MDELDRQLKDWARVRSRDLRPAESLVKQCRQALDRKPAGSPGQVDRSFRAWKLSGVLVALWLCLMGLVWLISELDDRVAEVSVIPAGPMKQPDVMQVWTEVAGTTSEPAVDLDAYASLIGGNPK